MMMVHYTDRFKDGRSDISVIRVELDGEDMGKLFVGDSPVLSMCNADGEVIQQVIVEAKKIGKQR